MKLKHPARLGVGIAVVALLTSSAAPAWASESAEAAAVDAIAAVAPESLDTAVKVGPSSGNDPIELTASELTVTLPSDSGEAIKLEDGDGRPLEVALPKTGDGADLVVVGETVAAYEDSANSVQVPLVKEEGALQILTVLENESASERFTYKFTSLGSVTPDITSSGDVILNGSDGVAVGYVSAPWALDATNAAVPTHFEVDADGALVQVVSHQGAGFQYPITADPYMGKNLISQLTFGSMNGYPRWNVYLTSWGRDVLLAWDNGPAILMSNGWSEVVAKNSGVNARASVRQQYNCHIGWAPHNTVWNLEAYRVSKPNWNLTVLSHRCNWES